MKYIINRDGFLLDYTEEFIEKGIPNGINILDWNIIETELIVDTTFKKPKWFNNKWIEGMSKEDITLNNQSKINYLNKLQHEELILTDWYYIRFLETEIPIPEEIIQQRQEIRNKYNTLINEINNE
jgi:hypothetical protein